MLSDEVRTRLQAEVAGFVQVEEAAELAALVEGGRAPQRAPAAFVLPLGLRKSAPDAITGLYRQRLVEMVAVVIVTRVAGDARGAAGLPRIHDLRDAVIAALAGWSPPSAFAPMELTRAALVSLNAGALVYQIDFGTPIQLRIPR